MGKFIGETGLTYLWSKIKAVFATKEDISNKQDALVSGTNIKTVNNNSLLGNGDINIPSGDTNVIETVKVNGTALTPDANKAVNVSVPTKVSDLTNDSGFITSYTEADPVFAASPAYGITSTDIEKWDAAAVVADDDGSATTPDFDAEADTVWHKAQTLSVAQKTQARTNIGAQEALTFDSSPTSASTNPVTSGGVYTALGNKQDTLVSGTNIKTINNESLLGSGNITIQGGGGGGEANVIESISINGTTQTVTSKNVDLPVPTSADVYSIVKLTQAAYDALATKVSTTLYIITAS